jgi:hypothetical protein
VATSPVDRTDYGIVAGSVFLVGEHLPDNGCDDGRVGGDGDQTRV